MDINFELYKIFYHAGTLKSFSAAADKLFISQSAVSQAIKNLEDKTGVQLFIRKSRHIKLTHEGEMLYRHVEQAYNFLKAGENKLLELQGLNQGEVRIGASDTVCKYHLLPFIQKYTELYPSIKIQLVNRTSSQIVDVLKNGLVDFGIVTLPVEDKSLTIEEFMSVKDVFVAGPRFTALRDTTVSIRDLNRHPLLLLPSTSATRRNLDGALSALGLRVTPEIELESIDLLVEYAKLGLGIAYVLEESTVQAIEAGQLFQIKVQERLPARKLGIVTMNHVPLSKAAAEFIQVLDRL